MAYLKNTWYVAAWDDEVKSDNLFQRTLLDESVLFFRDDAGAVQAISNRCPHRFAQLHMGKRVANGVQCAYHGLQFNGKGQCIHNPHGKGAIPKAAATRCYPVREKHGAIWIWPGDPALADPASIPDFSFNDPDRFYVGKRYLLAKANYRLEVDNIMDLSHIQYLHASTLGGENVAQATTALKQEGNTIWSLRTVHADTLSDFLYTTMDIPRGTVVDRQLDVRWDAPANMALVDTTTPVGRPEAAIVTPTTHLFTPESETTTHYWFAISFPRSMGEAAAQRAERDIDGLAHPFTHEDLPMLEGQQNMIGAADFWSLKPVLLSSDAPAIRARRVLDQLIASEQSLALKQDRPGTDAAQG